MWCMVLLSFIENVQGQIGGDDDPARFRPTVMSSSSFDAFKISEITFENGWSIGNMSFFYCSILLILFFLL